MSTGKPRADRPRSGRSRSATIIAEQRRVEKRRRLLLQLGIGLVVILAVLGTTIVALKSQGADAESVSPPNMTPSGGIELGTPTAPVRVIVVEDFGCPHCAVFETEAGPLLEEYAAGTDVKVEYRGIAFLDRAFSTDYSSSALNASACVAASSTTDVWKRFHDSLFEQQPPEGAAGLDSDALIALAVAAGAPNRGASDCVTSGTYLDWVKAHTASTLGHGGVDGTPTVFVNGVKVVQPSATTLKTAVEQALNR